MSIDNFMYIFVILSLYANLLVIQKNYNGFAIWIVTNSAWMIYDYYIGAFSQSALFLVYNMFAVYGLISWKYPLQTKFISFMLWGYLKNIFKR